MSNEQNESKNIEPTHRHKNSGRLVRHLMSGVSFSGEFEHLTVFQWHGTPKKCAWIESSFENQFEFLGNGDPDILDEVQRLKARVAELEGDKEDMATATGNLGEYVMQLQQSNRALFEESEAAKIARNAIGTDLRIEFNRKMRELEAEKNALLETNRCLLLLQEADAWYSPDVLPPVSSSSGYSIPVEIAVCLSGEFYVSHGQACFEGMDDWLFDGYGEVLAWRPLRRAFDPAVDELKTKAD